MNIFGTVLDTATDIAGKFFVDKTEKLKFQEELKREMEKNEALIKLKELDLISGQLRINEAQARHSSVFVAGARPALIWVFSLIMISNYIIRPYCVAWFGWDIPELKEEAIMPLIMGLLGVTGMRTAEKWRGVARNSLKE